MRKVCLVKTSLFICHSAAGKCNDDLVLMQTRANLSPRFLSVTRNCQLPNHPCSGDSTPPPLLFFLLYNALLMLSSLQYVMLCCVLQTSRLPSSLSQEIAKYQWSLTTSPSALLLQSALLWKGLCTILLCSELSYALLCPARSCQVPQQLYQTSAHLLLLYTSLYLVRFMHHSYCSTLLCFLFALPSTALLSSSSTVLYSVPGFFHSFLL